jgi:ATP-dependent helicase/nuclease subunit A
LPDESAPRVEFSWASRSAREVGSVVHRWLQRMAGDGLAGWSAARLTAARGAILNELAARGVAASDAPRAAEHVVEALRGALADDRGRWLLGPRHEARSEYRITVRAEGRIRHLVLDRTFRDNRGLRWIVDYKTSRHEGAGFDEFLDRELERYAPQLDGYAAAFPGEAVATGLYFPVLGGWRERGGSAPAATATATEPKRSPAADAQLPLEF